MVEFDSIDEILELAIEREIEANQLYKDLAGRTDSPIMRKVLEGFAEEELEHKAKLELEIIKNGRVVTSAARVSDFSLDDYIEDRQGRLDMDYKDVLTLAIEKERRSVRFYIELAAVVEDRGSREVLLSLAEEEAGHKARFEIEYERLVLMED